MLARLGVDSAEELIGAEHWDLAAIDARVPIGVVAIEQDYIPRP